METELTGVSAIKEIEENSIEDEPVVIHGEYSYTASMVLIALLAVCTILIIVGYSWVLELYLEFSSESDPESEAITDVCGLWGMYVLLMIVTVVVFLMEDLTFSLEFQGDRMVYVGGFSGRPDRRIVMKYENITSIDLELPEDDLILKWGHRIMIRDGSRTLSLKDPNFVSVRTSGLTRNDLYRLIVAMNERIIAGIAETGDREAGEESVVDEDVLGVFGKPEEEVERIIRNGIADGDITVRYPKPGSAGTD